MLQHALADALGNALPNALGRVLRLIGLTVLVTLKSKSGKAKIPMSSHMQGFATYQVGAHHRPTNKMPWNELPWIALE